MSRREGSKGDVRRLSFGRSRAGGTWATVWTLTAVWIAVFFVPEGSAAQQPGPVSLDAVETALDSGRATGARRKLNAWFADSVGSATEEARWRARYLRARSTPHADSARRLYAHIAVSGVPPYQVQARLRLAQLHLAEGDAERAGRALRLLRADYPGHALVPESWYWTGRVREVAGETEAACRAYRRAGAGLRREGSRALARRAGAALERCRSDEGEAASGFTVQLGAFRDPEAAEELADRVRGSGFEVRVVEAPTGGFHRVRSGRFESRGGADRQARRLRSEGFQGMVTEVASGGDR